MVLYIILWLIILFYLKDCKIYKELFINQDMQKKKVTINLDLRLFNDFHKYCNENAIIVSKKIEFFIRDFLKENVKNENGRFRGK